MELYSDDNCPLFLSEYIRSNPSSAISARWVFKLTDEEQGDCIAKMVESAVYQETWLSYFEYAEKKEISVTDEISLEAIRAVGLDPYSASLWLKVIELCSNEEKKRELFQLALRVPLYQQGLVYKAYKNFESEVAKQSGHSISSFPSLSEVMQYSKILETEPVWPDRFVDVQTANRARKDAVIAQWNSLLNFMFEKYEECLISKDLYLRRIELAFRQLCSQFSHEDICWYAYACFVAVDLKDEIQAREIVEKGRCLIGDNSIALRSLDALLSNSDLESVNRFNDILNKGIFLQRLYANAANASLQNRKRFRDVGKIAAANSLSDWRIYHQWAFAEQCVLSDIQMAARVYERGISCAANSLKDAVLLSNEAVKYHLWQQNEREVLGYAERQIELLSSTQHEGFIRASWNQLVHAESILGLPSLTKTLRRRAERCVDFARKSIIERYRVGNYIPCSDEELDWLEYVDDLFKARKEEQEPVFEGVTPLKHLTLSTDLTSYPDPVLPDVSLWSTFEMCPNREHSSGAEDSDEVVGSRTLRGRLVYKLKIDEKTVARLKREAQLRQEENKGVDSKALNGPHTALQALVEKLESKRWNASQLKMCRILNAEWLMNTLTHGELDLRKRRQ
ncbi:hypothetical protein C3747_107g90 [Trypanosoma cruzi]|uniref:Suppressor of forked domain-containing protein n=2 Tax=Trypanosoma cruzi TaxID=5693 RepID=Q4CY43_TRYCC|nr:hypothetical protein, conserved [Trypanosoma cruzi]EAN85196.1 hypothetical protein, conserved [Trypanosoma cruzi]KAF5220896.1 hypothetical protein ECC02_006056 [Trypanosoma cruzi]KAF8303794.1 hypothetical protein TcYC6_0035890 [Trypanosoma cruzi]PWV07007.1 hypothetical protein C3747_107g90 [Trypanosoma cruzi]|eukprot:XP_807047.1 hypothetical protein [Trypanosoma cruzi strain CL Brener]